MGTLYKASSKRLDRRSPYLMLTILGLKGQWLNHYATMVPKNKCNENQKPYEIQSKLLKLKHLSLTYMLIALSVRYISKQLSCTMPKLQINNPNYQLTDLTIRKTSLCNVYPLEPHFYIIKLGYAGVHLFFLFLVQNIDCGYSLEAPRRGSSNMHPQSMF